MKTTKNFLPKKLSKEGLQKLLQAKEQDDILGYGAKQKISKSLDSFQGKPCGLLFIVETSDEDRYREISKFIQRIGNITHNIIMYNCVRDPELLTSGMIERFIEPNISIAYISQEAEKIEREKCEQIVFEAIYKDATKVYI